MNGLTFIFVLFFLTPSHGITNFASETDKDAELTVSELITKNGYPVEEHFVTTQDGYILRLQRIPHGKDPGTVPQNKVVLLVHGLGSSSYDWVLSGPSNALGYILADRGYDVWLANTRGNHQSRNHTTLNPDKDHQFWKFTWHQCGTIDLPNMIDYILTTTGKTELYNVGHSQGTSVFYVMASQLPEYNRKVAAHYSITPTPFLKYTKGLVRFIADHPLLLDMFIDLFGFVELAPNFITSILGPLLKHFCEDYAKSQALCYHPYDWVFGPSENEVNSTLLKMFYAHAPAGGSTEQLRHFVQNINSNSFRQYDHGWLKNSIKYGSAEPPRYDLQKVTAPVYIFYSSNDSIVSKQDAEDLCKELKATCKGHYLIDRRFNHVDFLLGKSAPKLVYEKLLSLLAQPKSDDEL